MSWFRKLMASQPRKKKDESGWVDLRTSDFKNVQRQALHPLAQELESAVRALCQIVADGRALEEKYNYFRHPYHSDWTKADEYEVLYKAKYKELIPIGEKLNAAGGQRQMVLVAERVRVLMDDLAARILECNWDGIGDWHG